MWEADSDLLEFCLMVDFDRDELYNELEVDLP